MTYADGRLGFAGAKTDIGTLSDLSARPVPRQHDPSRNLTLLLDHYVHDMR